jgi:hypothetical protein
MTAYRELKKTIQKHTEFVDVFKLIFPKDNLQQIIDVSTKELVSSTSILFLKAFSIFEHIKLLQ